MLEPFPCQCRQQNQTEPNILQAHPPTINMNSLGRPFQRPAPALQNAARWVRREPSFIRWYFSDMGGESKSTNKIQKVVSQYRKTEKQ